MNVDWNELTMTFQTGEKQITLTGDPTLTKAKVSFKMLTRVWTEEDQGFLVELHALEQVSVEPGTEEDMVPELMPIVEDYASMGTMDMGLHLLH